MRNHDAFPELELPDVEPLGAGGREVSKLLLIDRIFYRKIRMKGSRGAEVNIFRKFKHSRKLQVPRGRSVTYWLIYLT